MDRMEKLGAWIAKNPLMIAAVAILMTIASVNFASQIQMHDLDTEDFVSTNSPLYEVYNHLYLENFGTQSIAILVEGSDVTNEDVVFTTIIGALTTGRTETTLIGLALIFLLLFLIYRGDLIKALLPVLPMLVVIGWMGGVMYLAGLKYTPLTATLGGYWYLRRQKGKKA